MNTFFVTSDNLCHIFVYKYSFVFISNSGLHLKILYKGKTKKSTCPIEEMNDHYSNSLRKLFSKMDTYSLTVLSKENHMMLFELATEQFIQLKEIVLDKDIDIVEMKQLEKQELEKHIEKNKIK